MRTRDAYAIQKRLYTVDDVWELQCQPGNGDRHYELVNGELTEMSPANTLHAWLAQRISRSIGNFAEPQGFGFVLVEGGFFPIGDRHTLLAPDVAFVSKARMPIPMPNTFLGFMPDLAVEIRSPRNTVSELREKAGTYLRHGTRLVWLVLPETEGVEVCRSGADGQVRVEFVGIEGVLSGEDVLPGFKLKLRLLFPDQRS